MPKIHYGILLFCLLQSCFCQNVSKQELRKQELDYYVDLVTQGIQDALNYTLPTNASEYYSDDYKTSGKVSGVYDYIVIGSGSGGATVAGRISELKAAKILLLEAGDREDDFVKIPGMAFYAQSTKYNWGYRTTPQSSACLGLEDKICPYPRGKGIGGTTLINGLVYARGNKIDFDRWESLGNKGWSYKDVLPFFLKSEKARFSGGDPGYFSTTGPLSVEQSPYETEQLKAYLQSNRELEYSILDYNGRNEIGASKAQVNTLNGRRFTSADAFLPPSLNSKKKNLTLSPNSFVTKILINKKTKVAYGVVYMQNGKKKIAIAKKEIILSAGAFGSPQILMLSGVGPSQHLQDLKIDVIANLSVGNNLIDHPTFFGLNILTNTSIPPYTLREILDQYLNGTGSYTFPGGNEGVGFYRADNNLQGLPDYELMLIPPNRTSSATKKTYRYTDETFKAMFDGVDITSTFSFYVIALETLSKGTLRLNSSNPFDYPLIDPRFLSDAQDHDITVIYNGVQNIIRMLDTDAFKKIDARLDEVFLPPCKGLVFSSKEYWFCTIRQLTKSINHPVGTCKMGNDTNNGAVVDDKFRVHGIRNLRVCDGSIMPDTLAGHPNAPITMFGEMLANFIKSGT